MSQNPFLLHMHTIGETNVSKFSLFGVAIRKKQYEWVNIIVMVVGFYILDFQ